MLEEKMSARLQQPRRCPYYLKALLRLGLFLVAFYLYTKFWTRSEGTDEEYEFPPYTHYKEQMFLSVPNAESALSDARARNTFPHLAGSSEDFEDAKATLEFFQSQLGIQHNGEPPIFQAGTPESRNATLGLSTSTKPSAWIDVYYPSLNTPLDRSITILDENGDSVESLDLVEDGDPLDPEAAKYKDSVPTFHGYSYNGEAEGPLVYANYGSQEDYDHLEAAGANLTGTIVLCRYGNMFRGLKVKGAQERGAVGVLIYSDTRNDGGVTVENGYKAYPAGPARNPTSVERGSVQFVSVYSGDPTTPGYPAYENATRAEPKNIPSIPSLPISAANAQRLLDLINEGGEARVLSGGRSATRVRLVNHVKDKVTPIWNVMASIPGLKDEVVVIGAHRDAWVMGAADPGSSNVVMRQVIRGIGKLLKNGWTPLRTIVFASWDAEEYGFVGSIEWAEDFAPWISENVAAYLNCDVAVGGSRLRFKSTPSLSHIIKRTALEIPHPTVPEKTLWDAQKDRGTLLCPHCHSSSFEAGSQDQSHIEDDLAIDDSNDGPHLEPLGCGSDYTVMQHRLGVPGVDGGFRKQAGDPVYHYHSIYDSQRWQETYGDPGFHRHVAIAKFLGLLSLRVVDQVDVPINTTHYAHELDGYVDKVENLAAASSAALDLSELRKSIKRLQVSSRILDREKEKAFKKLRKLFRKIARRHRRRQCPREWIKRFLGIWTSCERDVPRGEADAADGLADAQVWPREGRLGSAKPSPREMRKLIKAIKRMHKANLKLIAFERGFISEEGLKGREWYRHLGVAPGRWQGYRATTLPGLSEALMWDKNVTLAEQERDRLTHMLDKLAVAILP